MEKQGLCSECRSIHFALNPHEFQMLRIFLSDVLFRKGKASPTLEIYQFYNMLMDINDELRKENR